MQRLSSWSGHDNPEYRTDAVAGRMVRSLCRTRCAFAGTVVAMKCRHTADDQASVRHVAMRHRGARGETPWHCSVGDRKAGSYRDANVPVSTGKSATVGDVCEAEFRFPMVGSGILLISAVLAGLYLVLSAKTARWRLQEPDKLRALIESMVFLGPS